MPELDEELKDKETENLQDIDNAGEAGKEDELLSDAEIKKIADMNLDDIIEDATSDSVSVEDLFGNGDSAAVNGNRTGIAGGSVGECQSRIRVSAKKLCPQ